MNNKFKKPFWLSLWLILFFPPISIFAGFASSNSFIINPKNHHKIVLAGLDSIYSQKVYKLFQNNIVINNIHLTNLINVQCLVTASDQYYFAAKQELFINANANKIASVIEDFTHYSNLFDNIQQAKIVYADADLTTVFYDEKLPFFLPNIKHHLNHYIEDKLPMEKDYLHKLKDGDVVQFSDGFSKVRQISQNKCYILEYDFIKPELGILENFPLSMLWEKFVNGIILQDLLIKYRTENPTWDYEKIKSESENKLKTIDVEQIIKSKIPAERVFN